MPDQEKKNLALIGDWHPHWSFINDCLSFVSHAARWAMFGDKLSV